MLVFLHLIAVLSTMFQVPQSSCNNLKCSWTVNNQTLNMTPFQLIGVKVSKYDNNTDTLYSFTPCNNILPPGSMATSMTKNDTIPQELMIFDPDIQPTVKSDTNGEPIWNFQYNKSYSVQFTCNYSLPPSILMEFTEVVQIFIGSFIFRISSYYFCKDVTIPDDITRNKCVWRNATNVNFLDLRPLYGQRIKYTYSDDSDTTNFTAYINVCQNADYACYDTAKDCNKCVMADQCDPYTNSCDPPDSQGWFDPDVQPSYNAWLGGWLFTYLGVPSGEQIYGTFQVVWHCNPNITNYSVNANGVYDEYPVMIESVHACPTQLPCVFSESNGNKLLNLTEIAGQIIQYTDTNEEYSYEYSICRNNLVCPNNGEYHTMAVRWNISHEHCDPSLAIWTGNFNDGYHLSYNESMKRWKFSYYNGAICGDAEANALFDIIWVCNKNVTDWQVTDVIADSCKSAMYIDSAHAC